MLQRLQARVGQSRLGATLVRGGLGSSVVQGVHLAARVLTAVVLARVLGAEGFGIYALAMAIIRVMQIPAQSGISKVGMRFTAAYGAHGQWDAMRGLWRRLTQWMLVYGAAAIAGALVLALALGYYRQDGQLGITLAIAAPLLILLPFVIFQGALVRGLQHAVHGQMPEFVVRPVAFLLLVVLGAWLVEPERLSPEQAMLLQLLAGLLALGLAAYWLRRARPAQILTTAARFQSSQWFKAIVPLSLTGGLMLINNETDILMLGAFAEPRDVGVYRVAAQGANMVVFFLTALEIVIAPQISRLYTEGQIGTLQRILTWNTRIVFLGALCVALMFWLAGHQILGWVFGPEFVVGYTALAILGAGYVVKAGCGPVGPILNMTGFERETAFGAGVAAILNILLNAILIPRFGMTGAATATTISLLLWNVILVYRAYQRTGLDSTVWGRSGKSEAQDNRAL